MKSRTLLWCTVVGAIALFAWQSISNAALPFHRMTMKDFADTTVASAKTIRAMAPVNGMYGSNYGVLAAVSITPDMKDQTTMLGPMLGKQVLIDLVSVFFLCLVAARLRVQDPMAVATTAAFAALAASCCKELADANWYGFTYPYALVNIIDITIGFFIAGWVVGALARRLGRSDGVSVPAGA